MKPHVAVVFDLEDTLVETPWSDPQHTVEFRLKTKRKLIELGIPKPVLEGIERSTSMRNRAAEYVEQNFGKTEAERFKLEMNEFLSWYEIDSARRSKLFADVIPTLTELKRFGAKMALVTNTSAEAVRVVFRQHKLIGYFRVVITRENVRRLKPNPEGILLALKRLRVNSFVMVGDLVLDVLAAKRANGTCILVRRPEQSNSTDPYMALPAEYLDNAKETMNKKSDFGANYIVQSLTEIPAIIQNEIRRQDPGSES
jgi:HAD superfamily hydrolase (TIGR01549 family)